MARCCGAVSCVVERKLRATLPGGTFAGVSPARSAAMASIRSKNCRSTERALRMALIRAAITGWQLHVKLPGQPDIYFARQRLAVFVDGCFWHFCPKCGHIPHTRRPFWKAKIDRNRSRDRRIRRLLTGEGIRVIRIWEHQLRSSRTVATVISRLRKALVMQLPQPRDN